MKYTILLSFLSLLTLSSMSFAMEDDENEDQEKYRLAVKRYMEAEDKSEYAVFSVSSYEGHSEHPYHTRGQTFCIWETSNRKENPRAK